MLKVTDIVVVKDKPSLGKMTIVEIDNGIAYVELRSNGVEMEFKLGDLDFPAKADPISNEWMEISVGKETLDLVKEYHTLIVVKSFPGTPAWNTLPNTIKLNHVAVLAGLKNAATLQESLSSGFVQKEQLFNLVAKKLIDTGNKVRLERTKKKHTTT